MHFFSEGAAARTGPRRADRCPAPPRTQLGRLAPRTIEGRPEAGATGLGADLTATPRILLGRWLTSSPAQLSVLRARCRHRVTVDAWLIPARRLWPRVAARLSWEVACGDLAARRHLDDWIACELEALAAAQREELRVGLTWQASNDRGYFQALARALGLEPARARLLCVRVNARPLEERRRLRSAGWLGP
jgi:hypothetical protein